MQQLRAYGVMMNDESPKLELLKTIDLVPPERERGVVMLRSTFERLIREIENLKNPPAWYQNAAWALLGVCASFAIAYLTTNPQQPTLRIVFAAVSVASLLLGIGFAFLDRELNKHVEDKRDMIITELRTLVEPSQETG